ncbi:MAG: restriction endonuclease subunit S [Armatimonadetes bacterium]|nr:restriction endonuclease subunit S [Armatimonadota bacterium]
MNRPGHSPIEPRAQIASAQAAGPTADEPPPPPSGWVRAELGELSTLVTSGSRGWAQHYAAEGAAFIRMGNLDWGTTILDLRTLQRVRPPQGAEGERTRLQAGDILISITAELGMVALVQENLGEAYINQHIGLVRTTALADTHYLAWFIVSPAGQRELRKKQRGATKIGLGLDDLRAVSVPLAPLPEQHRIVAEIEKQFSRLDAAVAALKRVQANLKRYRAAVLQAACEGRLVPTEAELAHTEGRGYEPACAAAGGAERGAGGMMGDGQRPEELPPGWAGTTLGEIVAPTRPRHHPQDCPQLPFIGMEHVEAHTMRLLGTVPAAVMKSSAVHFFPGDVLYGRLRPYLNKIYRPDFEGLCSAEFIVLPPSQCIDGRFLQYRLNAADFMAFASHVNEGDRPRVDFSQLAQYHVWLPPLPEQRRIVAEVGRRLSVIDEMEVAVTANLKRAERLRQAILKRAFAGELVPQDPHDEPASALLERIRGERAAAGEGKTLGSRRGRPRKQASELALDLGV